MDSDQKRYKTKIGRQHVFYQFLCQTENRTGNRMWKPSCRQTLRRVTHLHGGELHGTKFHGDES
jgi:hypothetical protein